MGFILKFIRLLSKRKNKLDEGEFIEIKEQKKI